MSSQRYEPKPNVKRESVRQRVVAVASEDGGYGYRTVTVILKLEVLDVGKGMVYTTWREEGLKVPMKQPKCSRLWLADGSCIRLRPQQKKHVWSYDFVHDRTHDGKSLRILNIADEHSRECLPTVVRRRVSAKDVILILDDLFLKHGCRTHIRSDNGPEFFGKMRVGINMIYANSDYCPKL